MTPELIKRKWPEGSRIKYTGTSPIYGLGCIRVRPGDLGTVRGLDSAGDLTVLWDNGSFVSMEPGKDHFALVFNR